MCVHTERANGEKNTKEKRERRWWKSEKAREVEWQQETSWIEKRKKD